MHRSREQNATQKLLDLIREDKPAESDDSITQGALSNQQGQALSSGFPAKDLSLGVFINQTQVALALMADKGPREKVLVNWQTIPVPENKPFGTRDFPGFLSRGIGQFLGKGKKIPVWCALDSALLKLKQLTLPDLPPSKIPNATFWGLKKELGFDDKLEILDFEVLDDILVEGIKKKQVLAFSVPKAEVAGLKTTFSRAGFPLTGITAIPFAMQNFVRTGQIPSDHDYFAIVNIRQENSEVFCFSKTGIMLIRSLRTGALNLVEDLDIPEGSDPIDVLSAMDHREIQAYPGMQDPAERLISKIVRTGDYCAHNYTGNIPLKQYTFYGATDQCLPFMELAAAMIPAEIAPLKPGQENFSSGMDAGLPGNAEQRNLVLTAFSIALSSPEITPNFLYTYADRQRTAKARKMTLATLGLGVTLLACAGAAHIYLNTAIAKERAAIADIRHQEARFTSPGTEASISKTIGLAQAQSQVSRSYVQSYLPLAVVYEICRHTPDHIKLTGLTYTNTPGEKDADPEEKQLILNGRISVHPYALDSGIGNYMITLSGSPLFGDVHIQDKKEPGETGRGGQTTMTFTAILEVM